MMMRTLRILSKSIMVMRKVPKKRQKHLKMMRFAGDDAELTA